MEAVSPMSRRPDKQLARSLACFKRRLEQEQGIPPAATFWDKLGFWRRKRRQELRDKFNVQMRVRYVANLTHKIIYCPIEKNACTFFKRILIQHGECRQEWKESGMDVHSFLRKRKKLRLANENQIRDATFLRFVIVREPVERAVSAYLNKFVRNHDYPMAQQASEQYASLGRADAQPKRLMTFRQFVDLLGIQADSDLDNHWRSQVSFLSQVVECFDWIVPMNKIEEFLPVLERRMACKLPRRKTRNENVYHAYGLQQRMYDWYPDQLRELSSDRHYPDFTSLVTPDIRQTLTRRFQADVELYQLACQHFELKLGSEPLPLQTTS